MQTKVIGEKQDYQTPYHYARDHHGDAAWCVRGPKDFYLSVPEKNLAWCVAAMLNGHGTQAAKFARELVEMLEQDGFPDYLKEPAYIAERREQGSRTVGADPESLNMRDRLHKRLSAGWPSGVPMEDVIFDTLMEPTPAMIAAVAVAIRKTPQNVGEITETSRKVIRDLMQAIKDGA